MTADLVKRLRTCSAGERRNIAMELAQTGTDEAVAELIRMVEGRHRRGLSWYELDDQLIGVEALGETGTERAERALSFLREVYTTSAYLTLEHERVYYGGASTPECDIWAYVTYMHCTYPHARRQLSNILAYTEGMECEYEEGTVFPENFVSKALGAYNRDKAHAIFEKAIERLESTVNAKLRRDYVSYLREIYPFLEHIIAQQPYALVYIVEGLFLDSVLAAKCHDRGSEGPKAFDEQFYSVCGGEVVELAVSVDALGGERRAKEPSPSVRDELSARGITPDFLVEARHLQHFKYDIEGEHRHESLILTLYRIKSG